MSSDREEIRWRFQILLNSVKRVYAILDDERKEYQENLYHGILELKEIRNSFVAGIGSGIGIFLTLISIGSLPKENAGYVIIGIIGAISIFVGFNIYSSIQYRKYNTLQPKYMQILGDMASLEGLLSTTSLNENVSKENTILLTKFVFVIGQVFVYELQYYAHNMIRLIKPDQGDFRETFKLAKEDLDEFKSMTLVENYIPRIELFIKMFEKNETKKKNKKPKSQNKVLT